MPLSAFGVDSKVASLRLSCASFSVSTSVGRQLPSRPYTFTLCVRVHLAYAARRPATTTTFEACSERRQPGPASSGTPMLSHGRCSAPCVGCLLTLQRQACCRRWEAHRHTAMHRRAL
ncbi:hypothetical protein V5799_031927 [Amblyomma americanum]|uniref:Uncharacterized protein n=1 Tax=Amblyomma americanum TaxID=6943 RepID=A0AAQ4DSM0_AMBAM